VTSKPVPRSDTAHVLAPPPVIFVGALALGAVLQAVRPAHLFPNSRTARLAGGCLIAAGVALSAAVMYHFGRADTPVTPWSETRRLVVSGPYRFSRNPDYVGQTLITGGLGLLLDLPWVVVALVPALVLVRYGVIAREERYLEQRFGADYREFRSRIRRWL
jgi:protein-S-isoprenylcysteine O-methyltransferase Ste14